MKNIYYHGTSMENAINIVNNGFIENRKPIWDCVDPDKIYLACNRDEPEDYESFELSFGASQIAAAFYNSMSENTVIFEFVFRKKDENEYIFQDDSCDNIYGCYQISCQDLNRMITDKDVQIKIHILKKSYNPFLRIFYLKNLSMDWLNFSDQLYDALERINNDSFVEDLFLYDSDETISLFQFKKRIQNMECHQSTLAA